MLEKRLRFITRLYNDLIRCALLAETLDTKSSLLHFEFLSLKHQRQRWSASEWIIMIYFHHPLIYQLSFKGIDTQTLKKSPQNFKCNTLTKLAIH